MFITNLRFFSSIQVYENTYVEILSSFCRLKGAKKKLQCSAILTLVVLSQPWRPVAMMASCYASQSVPSPPHTHHASVMCCAEGTHTLPKLVVIMPPANAQVYLQHIQLQEPLSGLHGREVGAAIFVAKGDGILRGL